MTDTGPCFHPVDIQCGHIHIVGGFSGKKSPVTSRTIVTGPDRTSHIFVKMSTAEAWMRRVLPHKLRRSGSTLLNVLRTHIRRKADGFDGPDDDVPPGDEYDPMDEISSGVDANALVPAAGRNYRARYYRNWAKHCIVTVNLPCRCLRIDPTCKDMRLVTLYLVDRKTIWLSINDVAWAVQYINDELQVNNEAGEHNN